MTDRIGALEIYSVHNPPSVSFQSNVLQFEGHMDTRAKLAQLQEMFRKAEGGTTVHTMIGGIQIGFDCTEGSVLTQYCEFSQEHLQDGFYLLRKLNINFIAYPSYYPFAVELFFLGTKAFWQDGYMIYGLDELDNDWE